MKKTVYKHYKQKARKLYKSTKNQDKDLWKHVKAVKKVAKYFCKNTDLKKKEKRIVYLGCILHDIGKTDEVKKWYGKKYKRENHHKIGKKYLYEKFFNKNPIDESEKQIILGMVEMHNSKFELNDFPYDNIEVFVISLVRFADKFANKKILMNGDKFCEKHKKGKEK